MKISQRLQQKQSQSLVMTPQLVQSIKLLQLSNIELAEFVCDEIEKNPLLELDPATQDHSRRQNQDESAANSDNSDKNSDSQVDVSEMVTGEMPIDATNRENVIDASFENVYDAGTAGAEQAANSPSIQNEASGFQNSGSSAASQSQDVDFIARLGEQESLVQHLETQIACAFRQPENREIATEIAHGLDEDGYFREDTKDAAGRLNVSLEQFMSVLQRFQGFEPAGIGARDLAECLALQLKDRNRFDPAMQTLLANLDLLARQDFAALERLCGVSHEDFHEMIREIRALDPRPAAQYEPILAEPVVPDVLVQQNQTSGWAIELNPEALPKVLVNRNYYAELSSSIETPEGQEFVAECLNTANWLTKSLDQRAQTILKVAIEIVKQQDMFFSEGVDHLRPLNLKTIADAIKMHESTVSRVTSNKYLMCDRGMFELKYFFSTALPASEGDETHSAESVRYKIKQLIDAEPADAILSDDAIVTKLQSSGIKIARRTVAKYREAIRIPSSVQRRRVKRNIANTNA